MILDDSRSVSWDKTIIPKDTASYLEDNSVYLYVKYITYIHCMPSYEYQILFIPFVTVERNVENAKLF